MGFCLSTMTSLAFNTRRLLPTVSKCHSMHSCIERLLYKIVRLLLATGLPTEICALEWKYVLWCDIAPLCIILDFLCIMFFFSVGSNSFMPKFFSLLQVKLRRYTLFWLEFGIFIVEIPQEIVIYYSKYPQNGDS